MTAFRKRRAHALGITVALSAMAMQATAQERTTAFQGARILPVAAAPIDDGVLIVTAGKIQLVGQCVAKLLHRLRAVAGDDRAVHGDRFTGPYGAVRA